MPTVPGVITIIMPLTALQRMRRRMFMKNVFQVLKIGFLPEKKLFHRSSRIFYLDNIKALIRHFTLNIMTDGQPCFRTYLRLS